jgi:hypothetical protein
MAMVRARTGTGGISGDTCARDAMIRFQRHSCHGWLEGLELSLVFNADLRGASKDTHPCLNTKIGAARFSLKVLPPAPRRTAKTSTPTVECNTRRTWPVGLMTCEPVWMLLLNTLERSARAGLGWSGLSECTSSQGQSKD